MATVNEKMTAIADAMREYGKTDNSLTLDAMAQAPANIYKQAYQEGEMNGYERGEEEGFAAGEAKHTSRYATGTIYGNDSTTLTIPCPFEPDAVILQHYQPLWRTENVVHTWQADFRAFATQIGMLKFSKDGTNTYSHIGAKTIKNFVKYKDGTITFTIPSISQMSGVTHGSQILYNYSFVKYTTKDDYTLLVEEIERLNSVGGSIQYSELRVQEAIEEAMTKGLLAGYTDWEEVWKEVLIKKQPNWTFSFG